MKYLIGVDESLYAKQAVDVVLRLARPTVDKVWRLRARRELVGGSRVLSREARSLPGCGALLVYTTDPRRQSN